FSRMISGVIACTLLLLLPGCDRDNRKTPAPGDKDGGAALIAPGIQAKMPEFSLPSAHDGRQVKSASWQGRVRLVVFFSPWCSSCSAHLAMLQELQRDYDPAEFSVIGIAIIESKEAQGLDQFIARLDLEFPILIGNDRVREAFGGVSFIPTTFLVDRYGNIVKKEITHQKKEDLAAPINLLLRKRP
ncbi:MAG TPA: TlpA disulfide reductase family protein, partial [Desulfurivibrionaceae bacterium]|nr:TlpA disulfide reductase family protein [Desulfurivibrionaceae bacterium]